MGVLVRFLLLTPSVAFSSSRLLFSAPSVVFSIMCKLQFSDGIFSLFLGCIMSVDIVESFHIRFTSKNYSAWEFQFTLFVKEKELWSHIDGSAPAPPSVEALSKWEIKDARVMTWILSSVAPHLVLNLKPYKTAAAMWNYLNMVYNQDNSARRFQLEYEMANFTQGSLSIEEYFSGFQTLWADYSNIVYANVPAVALSAVQAVHATTLANPNTLTPEMVQLMIIDHFCFFCFWALRNYDGNLKINTADGSSLPISAVGDISSSLTDVFVSPDLSTNLSSVGSSFKEDDREGA
ncbi:hypothetical protein Patl1_33820 [Pistacia atlantica]|uniref:Uncharacterized protein n=1 Tax=Pistacia atlantica TaxID=434234 RepID=A0ACC0ZQT9_9ROSI|nr:hypothetical protein Patl1_33820 [Pistacia atlantica]